MPVVKFSQDIHVNGNKLAADQFHNVPDEVLNTFHRFVVERLKEDLPAPKPAALTDEQVKAKHLADRADAEAADLDLPMPAPAVEAPKHEAPKHAPKPKR